MGTDFDGLVKTFQNNEGTGKRQQENLVPAEQTIEAQMLNKITGRERIIEKIKADIGDIVYRRHSG